MLSVCGRHAAPNRCQIESMYLAHLKNNIVVKPSGTRLAPASGKNRVSNPALLFDDEKLGLDCCFFISHVFHLVEGLDLTEEPEMLYEGK